MNVSSALQTSAIHNAYQNEIAQNNAEVSTRGASTLSRRENDEQQRREVVRQPEVSNTREEGKGLQIDIQA